MEEGRVFEPNRFARYGVIYDRLEYLPRSQTILAFPLKTYARIATILFHVSFTGCLKCSLPGEPQSVAIVAHIHDVLFQKSLADRRIQALVNSPSVGDRCCASLVRRSHTEEPQLHGPTASIRLFVMKVNRLVGRIVS